MKRIGLSILIISTMLLSLCACRQSHEGEVTTITEAIGPLQVAVLAAGKADASVITTDHHTVVIDTGLNKFGKQVVDYLKSQGIDTIDYLIITHFDKDHVGGADTIIKELNVKNVVQPNYTSDSKQYKQYVEAMTQKGITPIVLTEDVDFTLDESTFHINPPDKSYYGEGEENDFSLVTTITHGNHRFLFAGDAEEQRVEELLSKGNLEAQFLKVPYHGRLLKNSKKFLDAVNPQYAVITCSKEDPASWQVLRLLSDLKATTYETVSGMVIASSDGINMTVHQEAISK